MRDCGIGIADIGVLLAYKRSTFAYTVFDIIAWGTYSNVIRITARRVVTGMQCYKSWRDRAICFFKSNNMCAKILTLIVNRAIAATSFTAGPRPAVIRSTSGHLRPKYSKELFAGSGKSLCDNGGVLFAPTFIVHKAHVTGSY